MYESFGIPEALVRLKDEAEKALREDFQRLDGIKEINQLRVIKAMQTHQLADHDFNWTTGYGYHDVGRDKLEKIYATLFGTEDALVRPQIVSGTHALSLALWGVLRPEDHMLSITGEPYDTLKEVIGIAGESGSALMDFGITFSAVDLKEGGDFDEKAILDYLKGHRVKMVYIQRSGGYDSRGAVTVDRIAAIIETIKKDHPDVMVMVDNCYGEFIETREPTHVGADLMAGSLIKNPGGGLALSGGYIAGREKWIHRVAERLTAPGIAKEVGTSYGQTRIVLQGLFLAPGVVNAALRGALLLGRMALSLGYEIVPGITDERSDIIQGIVLKEPGKVADFCQGVQNAAPVDAHVHLEPWAMPGYQSPVIMAAGAFVQGSSIELSADAPMREPYTVYFQGGLTYEHSKLGALMGLAGIYKG